ncbi:carbamoyl-phosphate synthase large subunit [Acidaminococcus sp. CAG:917]|nr:carbamoyl-phosphate synthase large subunit [Acidaminococcus sp. CAG:917]
MKKLFFTKMQGIGNDYIYFDCFKQEIDNPSELAVKLSDRHFGIGGDGIVLICPSKVADAKMRMFNLDGSEGKMCGNAIRCVGKYLFDNAMVDKKEISIETLSGIKYLTLYEGEDGKIAKVKVDMGQAELEAEKIPVTLKKGKIISEKAMIGNKEEVITCVSMGNPHCVVFVDSVDGLDLEKIGPVFENAEIFPDRINTEFIEVLGRNKLKMRVWERGSGETLACGTGACASAVAAVLNGYADMGKDITVSLIGGDLTINYTNKSVMMTGEAAVVFSGEVEI